MRRLFLALSALALTLPAQEPEAKVVTRPSGLKIEMLVEGKPGTAPRPGDRVKTHYTGWLADGTKFDSTVEKGKPLEFIVGVRMVIDGWEEAIPLINVGSKCKLFVPASLAFGAEGLPRAKVPGNSDLVYEMELLSVVKGKPVPVFRPADPEKQKTTPSGLKWEVLAEGKGDALVAADVIEMRCTLWTTEGAFAFSSAAYGSPITGEAGSIHLSPAGEKFLPEAVLLMKPGGACRFEVPPGLCWGNKKVLPRLDENVTTIWQIDVDRVVRFAPLDAAKSKKTESGLEYEMLEEGTGATPGPAAKVAVHYTGWLEDGKEFDSSRRRGQPAVFALNQVIKGWTEGLQLMREGATCRFRIPAALAYAEKGMGDRVPPNATLIFDVTLLRAQ